MYYDFQKVTLIRTNILRLRKVFLWVIVWDTLICLQGFKGLELSPLPSITSQSCPGRRDTARGLSKRRINDKTPQHIFLYQQTPPAYFSLSAVNPSPPNIFFSFTSKNQFSGRFKWFKNIYIYICFSFFLFCSWSPLGPCAIHMARP